jgi:hypothetical protein
MLDRRFQRFHRVILLAAAACAATLIVVGPASAAAPASAVKCGGVIKKDTTLQSDLSCPGAGIVIGKSGITLNLNGHTVNSAADCTKPCSAGIGIDNSGGYDRVRIMNGTVSYPGGYCYQSDSQGCGRSIVLAGAKRNKLSGLTITAGFPGISLSDSDHNRISANSITGGYGLRFGDAIDLVNGSDDNVVADNMTNFANGLVVVSDSAGNRLARNTMADRYGPEIELSDASQTQVVGNHLTRRGLTAVGSDGSLIAHNDVVGEISISGDGYRVANNTVLSRVPNDGADGFESQGIDVVGGDANLVRGNAVSSAKDDIAVEAVATHTLVVGNLATQPASCLSIFACDDGIDVDAPGTFIRANVATNNGDYGIEAVPGVIDGGRNRASGNGNPLQCVNVRCR